MVANARHENALKSKLTTESAAETRDSAAVMVTAEPITRRLVQRNVEGFGSLHGFEEVTISARVEGRVKTIQHDVGDRLLPGERLLEIDPTDYELSVQQSDRALQVELAKLGLKDFPDSKLDLTKVPVVVKAKAIMDHAKTRSERLTRLAATKSVSAEDSDKAANDLSTAQAEYDNQLVLAESGIATIQLKQVELQISREHLANTKVTVPQPTVTLPEGEQVTYLVSQRSVSEGTLVRPGTELFRIVISQTLKLRVPVPERYSAEVAIGQKVDVFTAALPTPFAGVVTRIHPTVDLSTRTFQVEIQVPNPKGELKPGSFAKASILTRIDSQAATVPLAALVQFAGITKIFLVNDGRAKEVPVTLGTQTTEWVEITAPPLTGDEQVVTSGQTAIANDSPITIRTPHPDAEQPASPGISPPARGHRE